MVGILIASHGDFAKGIKMSAEMIFGQQDNVAAVTLQPTEGPDDIRKKMEVAIATFEDPEQVLILCDLFGGTPFNQANGLIHGHEDTWAILTGMNLPMLIEALASRFSMETAHAIATHVITTAKEGVQARPASLQPKETQAVVETSKPTGPIPEGTVLGDGHIHFVLARIDSRLLHGQVATGWTKTTKPNRIIVASDTVAHDALRKQMIMEAAPPGVPANVVPLYKLVEVSKDPRFGLTQALVLFENPQDALQVIASGVDIKTLNIGSMAHKEGKCAVNQAISLDREDVRTFEKLKALGVQFDVRKVPSDPPGNMDALIVQARKELA